MKVILDYFADCAKLSHKPRGHKRSLLDNKRKLR
jgi:hypothetical protein